MPHLLTTFFKNYAISFEEYITWNKNIKNLAQQRTENVNEKGTFFSRSVKRVSFLWEGQWKGLRFSHVPGQCLGYEIWGPACWWQHMKVYKWPPRASYTTTFPPNNFYDIWALSPYGFSDVITISKITGLYVMELRKDTVQKGVCLD